jgi:streptogramin lyase
MHLASSVFGAPSVDAVGRGIGVDTSGRVWITGHMTMGSVDFGRGSVTASAPYSVLLLGLSSSAAVTYSAVFGKTGYHLASDLAALPSGSFAIAGSSSGTIDFGGGTLGTPYTSSSTSNAFIATFGPGPVLNFGSLIPSSVPLGALAVALDAQGNAYIAGETELSTSPILVTVAPRTELVRVHTFPGSDGRFDAIAVDGDGNVVVGGWLDHSADFGFGTLTGYNDLVIAKFTPRDL